MTFKTILIVNILSIILGLCIAVVVVSIFFPDQNKNAVSSIGEYRGNILNVKTINPAQVDIVYRNEYSFRNRPPQMGIITVVEHVKNTESCLADYHKGDNYKIRIQAENSYTVKLTAMASEGESTYLADVNDGTARACVEQVSINALSVVWLQEIQRKYFTN